MGAATDRDWQAPPRLDSRTARRAVAAAGGLLGGLAGGAVVVSVTSALKAITDFVAAGPTTWIIVVPVVGLAVAILVLQGVGRGEGTRREVASKRSWRTFPRDAIRADITGDVVDSAGREERFPWRLAPLRALAIFATVGLGGPLGTEAPAAYLGVATGAWLGDRGRRWRRLLRPAALGAASSGVAALMGQPLIGAAYMLELGRRHRAPLSDERLIAAMLGGAVGWGINVLLGLDLIRLIVPKEAPTDLLQAVKTALFIGGLSGMITALAGSAIYYAKKWDASPALRFVTGGFVLAVCAFALMSVAEPRAAIGPGGGAILWAEAETALPLSLLAVALLRATATVAAVAAGGCGGVFVPFLAIGDISGRVFAPALDVGDDLAGAAGAAGGIAGGYRLPFTAATMVLGIGGPRLATLTCLGTVVTASIAGAAGAVLVDRLTKLPYLWKRAPAH
jgi:CIC family chloride channel protein